MSEPMPTLNACRRRMGLPPMPHGDIPLSPTYVQALGLAFTKYEAEKSEGGK